MEQQHWLFWDLDGTLVDSASTILSSLQWAFKQSGLAPSQPLVRDLIGPPLQELLERLLPAQANTDKLQVLNLFKSHYDEIASAQTVAYPLVDHTLNEVHRLGFSQAICTNKRMLPTARIVEARGWSGLFANCYALPDYKAQSTPLALTHKSQMLDDILQSENLNRDAVVLIGDTTDDQKAAHDNQVQFAWARWGYGAVDANQSDWILENCEDILSYLSNQ
jgi:phosphoglycolate phosphatase